MTVADLESRHVAELVRRIHVAGGTFTPRKLLTVFGDADQTHYASLPPITEEEAHDFLVEVIGRPKAHYKELADAILKASDEADQRRKWRQTFKSGRVMLRVKWDG